MSYDIALIGLAVMGQNLILNMNDNGYKVVAYNRTASVTHEFLEGSAKGTDIIGAESYEEMVSKLSSPRKIMLMVKAGKPVDSVIETLLPLLNEGDGKGFQRLDDLRGSAFTESGGLWRKPCRNQSFPQTWPSWSRGMAFAGEGEQSSRSAGLG